MELGRRVTISDILAVHPGKPARCICRGTAEIALWSGDTRTLKPCQRAVAAFRHLCAHRVVDTDHGPRWILGLSPEDAPGEARKPAQ